ncbi:unnamed protein product [Lepidochelys olivacea]
MLKGTKKLPSESATVSSVGSKGIPPPDFEQHSTLKSLLTQNQLPLKRGKKFPSEAAAVGSKGIRPPDFELHSTSNSLVAQSQPSLKRAKKSTSETARVGSKRIRTPPPPDFEPPCTTRAKKSTSAASRDTGLTPTQSSKGEQDTRGEAPAEREVPGGAL